MAPRISQPERGWHKSSASTSGQCVEVSLQEEYVLVRDSKDPDGTVLRFTPGEWTAFLIGVNRGEFNLG